MAYLYKRISHSTFRNEFLKHIYFLTFTLFNLKLCAKFYTFMIKASFDKHEKDAETGIHLEKCYPIIWACQCTNVNNA